MGFSDHDSPFHFGELAIQNRAGVRERAQTIGQRSIRSHLLEQHQEFFAKVPFVVFGALDDHRKPWASLLAGSPGFIQVPDAYSLHIGALPAPDDPLAGTLHIGNDIGLLGIETTSRRRNRLNGSLLSLGDGGMVIRVKQSFGNCPKYIQVRSLETRQYVAAPLPPQSAIALDDAAISLIRSSDTFFIATHAVSAENPRANGADVSHRGGKPGFVRVDDQATLVWPDFIGNNFFNTLGNLYLNPSAGLLFPDFNSGDLLYLTGKCEIVWEGHEVDAFEGAQRLVRFHVEGMYRRPRYLPWRFSAPEPSPFLADTGEWLPRKT
ncbi:pyridoxamine 5'-phosphate oxidase family protein [Ralstonia wenshanensis]|uniref:pyridoxamine 5'-phosphate oxidase family protein n=1 Tax=Ralstonia wenshanensis TaxID=2842456 RepID=UPI002AAEA2EB|nr:pyridoxamine 5'-phosphate oxidase family protein [Ralstonia wenshanensis]MDY7511262.1 pyridoxamine 5'-phosphate oxidase family protein [Ralstonia wenshanensis]